MHQPTIVYGLVLFVQAVVIVAMVRPKCWWITVAVAPVVWTFEEYVAHRFLLHSPGIKPTFASHRSHHKRPERRDRLLIPVEITIAFALVNTTAFALVTDVVCALWFLVGVTVCYFLFEYVHVCAHTVGVSNTWMSTVTAHHRRHHIRPHCNYGFTSATWDILFGTYDGTLSPWLLLPIPIIPFLLRDYSEYVTAFVTASIFLSLPWTLDDTNVDAYRTAHSHPGNIIVHIVCVPVLVWTVMRPLCRICGIHLVAAIAVSYGLRSKSIGLTIVLLGLARSAQFATISNRRMLTLHILSWLVQVVVGHGLFEGKRPALIDSLISSVCVAPYVVYVDAMSLWMRG